MTGIATAVDLVLPDDSTLCCAYATLHIKVSRQELIYHASAERCMFNQLEEYDYHDREVNQTYTAMIFTWSMVS